MDGGCVEDGELTMQATNITMSETVLDIEKIKMNNLRALP